MSQHIHHYGEIKYVYGWDQPLQSFYLQMHNKDLPEEEQIVVWLGADQSSKMYEVEDLVREANKIGLYLSQAQQRILYLDKDEGQ